MEQNWQLKLHNWRCFESASFEIPKASFVLCDNNGIGKTSVLSAFYSLLTGKSWFLTKFSQNLKQNCQYFGLSTDRNDWFLSGKLSGNRVITKFSKPELFAWKEEILVNQMPAVLTYLPTDNLWFSYSRSQKLEIWDTLLSQTLGAKYEKLIRNLDLAVSNKQKLIRRCQEEIGYNGEDLNQTFSQQIYEFSLEIWLCRQSFFRLLFEQIEHFGSWIELDLGAFELNWQLTNLLGQKQNHTKLHFEKKEQNWSILWQKELLVGQVLFGAQRDEVELQLSAASVQNFLSRGQMRLLILFIKNLSKQILQQKLNLNFDQSLQFGFEKYAWEINKQLIFWLLDDVFNELDLQREDVLLQKVLSDSDFFWATTTKKVDLKVDTLTLANLTK